MYAQALPTGASQSNGELAFIIKAYSTKELLVMYDVTYKTFKKWLKPFQKEIGKKQSNYYTVLQVEIIIKKIGAPHIYRE